MRVIKFGLALILLVVLMGLYACAQQARHPNLRAQSHPKLIPLRTFFANRQAKGAYSVSPDGKKIAWRGVHGFRPAIFVMPIKGGQRRVITQRVRYYHWASDSRHLILSQDRSGNENYHLYLVDTLNPKRVLNLTPFNKVRAHLQQTIKNNPHEILITHNKRNIKVFDLYRYHLKTQQWTLMAKNPGTVIWWHTDRRGQLIARTNHLKTWHQLELKTKTGWRTIYRWRLGDQVSVGVFSRDRRSVYLRSNVGRDKMALIKLSIKTGRTQIIAQHPEVDIRRVDYSERERKPIMATATPGYDKRYVFSQRLKQALDKLPLKPPYRFSISSVSDDETVLTYVVSTDKMVKHYLYDAKRGQHQFLANAGINRVSALLSDMTPFRFKARDKMTLHGYYTRSRAYTGPLPTVVLVHGGPWARDYWALYKWAQLLANRGYLVLQINYRGSNGYGRRYSEAAIGEFGRKMHFDLLDGLDWAIRANLADPKAVAIMGGSYGGYATLVGMTMTPRVFQCGVDLVGMSDLVSLLKNVPPYWAPWMKKMYRYIGDPRKPDDVKIMKQRSPIHFVHQIEKPILIIHGAHDPRVKRSQSDRMVKKMREAGKQVHYLLLPDEGHSIRRWQTKLKVFRRIEDFLAKCIGGRSRGFDWYQLGTFLSSHP